MTQILLLLALSAAAPAEPAPLFVDWRALNRESLDAETARLKTTRDQSKGAEARALGERVGEIVAAGDCAEGERVARAAGDIGLVRAVRDFCYR